jgi:hypothetical protein
MKGREPYKIRPKEKKRKENLSKTRRLAPSRATRNFLGNKPQRRHGMLQNKTKQNKTNEVKWAPKNQSNFEKIKKINSPPTLRW